MLLPDQKPRFPWLRRLFLIGFFLLFLSPQVHASLPDKTEYLFYDVNLFNMLKALEVKIHFRPGAQKDLYLAHLELRPVGLLKFVMPYKKLYLYSEMRLVENSSRLRPEYVEKKTLGKDRVYRGVYRYNYDQGIVTGQGFFDDKPLAKEVFPLPKEAGIYYDDFLTFLYNFRAGAYGGLNPGEIVRIYTVPTKNKGMFDLEIGDEKMWSQFDPVEGASHVLALKLDKKILGFHVDRFFIWLSKDFLPLYGLVRDVVGWGDIEGHMRRHEELS